MSTPNELVESHLWLVPAAIRQMPRSPMDADDLAAAGRLGLVAAALAYDETRGVPFRLYAALRIRGAVQDAMRREDWLPRLERARVRAGAAVAAHVGSLDAPAVDDGSPLVDLLPALGGEVDEGVIAAQTLLALTTAIGLLPPRTGLAVTRRYFHGVTYRVIGDELGISESGACQLVSRGLTELRKLLHQKGHESWIDP